MVDKHLPTLDFKRTELAHVANLVIPTLHAQLPARAYASTVPSWSAPLPVVLHFHGGGFTVGSVNAYENYCRKLAALTDALVISVDYRLAPEHQFPCAVDDCFAAYRWLLENAHAEGGDPSRVAITGDSAGGTLATVTCLLAREAGLPQPKLQALVYPGTSATQAEASHLRLTEGYLLDRNTIQWFFQQYLRSEADRQDWRFGPLITPSVADLAPAWIAVAEYDPLVDEGMAYAKRLEAAGVPTVVREYAGQIHGFFNFGGYSLVAKDAVHELARALREALERA
jgi:acetyl esterase